MHRIIGAIIPTLLAAGALGATEASPATRPTSAAMQERIKSLEARIEQLQAENKAGNEAGNESGDAQPNQVVRAVINDAQNESAEFPNGWDPSIGFILQSPDGNNSIHPSVLFQFREEAAMRQRVPAGGGGETGASRYDNQDGFEVSRMRLMLDGNVIDPNFTYFFQWADDASMRTATMLDAYVMYRVSAESPLAMKAGQFKDPVWHEANLMPSMLLAVDRSLANQFLGGGQTNRVQGGDVIYDQNRTRAQLAFTDGYNSGNTKFIEAGGQGTEVGGGEGETPTNFGISARGEYLLMGDRRPDFNPFAEYDQFTSMNAKQEILVVGGGMDYSESGRDKIVFHTVDAQYNGPSGWSGYAAFLGDWRQASSSKGAPGGSYYDYGFLIQTACMLTPTFEPFLRYDYSYLNGKSLPGVHLDVLHEVTAGINYYFHGQRVKGTLDASWLPNGIPTDADNLGYLQDDAHGEFSVRVQLQLAI